MKKFYTLGLAALLATPMAFAADMPTGSIAGYLTSSELDFGASPFPGASSSDDGNGFGIKGWGSVSDAWFVHGEYQTTSLDDYDIDLESLRFGGGMVGEMSPGTMWLVKAEYVDFGSDADQAGFGVHGGMMFGTGGPLSGFATLGYLTTDDTDGLEFDVGGKYSFTKELAGFIDYRAYMGSVDPSGDFDVTDIRIGVAYSIY